MIAVLVILPTVAALASFLLRSNPVRRGLLVVTAVLHSALVAWCWVDRARFSPLGAWLAVDGPGLLFLSITSLLFLAASVSTLGFLRRESGSGAQDVEEGFLFDNAPEAVFTACLLGFLAAMTLVTISQHMGLLWVAVEATTLVSAPLIHYHRHHRSLEAAWKYILLCSVGIAIALLGTYFLAAAVPSGAEGGATLTFPTLLARAGQLNPQWLKAAFLLMVVGYGTKMGLAPMHTWLPDAHSEAPSVVSTLLSGALLNCAFLAILRIHAICTAAGLGAFGRQTILVLGLVSMTVAAGLIIGQPDFKRMLAYSSVEHMGILAVGVGLGGAGVWGALFHAVNHSLAKAALFLVAGNILAVYGTKKAGDVRGAMRVLPASGVLWIVGLFAITGFPPFGTFVSELTILRAAIVSGSWFVVVVFLLLLSVVFVGMATVFLRMAQGEGPKGAGETAGGARGPAPLEREPFLTIAMPILLLAAAAALGLFLPDFLDQALRGAASLLGA